MIEWKKYTNLLEDNFPRNKEWLVTDGKTARVALFRHEHLVKWWNLEGKPLAEITHYAEINLPIL